jgi:hypothetical protein
VEPRVSIQLPEPGRVTLLARIPCPARKKGRMEQTILRRFLADFRTPLPVAEEKKDHPRETD